MNQTMLNESLRAASELYAGLTMLGMDTEAMQALEIMQTLVANGAKAV